MFITVHVGCIMSVQRSYETITIPRDFCAYQYASLWACPSIVAVLKLIKKTAGSSRDLLLKHCSFDPWLHSYYFWESRGITLKNRCRNLLRKVNGDKVMTQHFNVGM